jgi:flagellar hook-associated protein 2
MSTISSGVGLISGLPIQDLVDAMIEVQRRPIVLMQNRLSTMTSRRTALLQISAQLMAVQNAASRLGSTDFFRGTTAASSDESSVLATAGAGAAVGQYTFTVRNLATNHQVISRGVASRTATPIGAGTLTIETGQGLLSRSTLLGLLNGGAGVQAGRIRVTDRAGNSVQIDLTTAQTIEDVVNAVNEQGQAEVAARVQGDRLILEDKTGLATGTLSVSEVGHGRTAADLGILGASAGGVITGSDLVFLSSGTRLANLNDGNSVRCLKNQGDFSVALADGTTLQFGLSEYLGLDTPLSLLNSGAGVPAGRILVTNRAGAQFNIDLSAAATIGDVKTAVEAAGGGLGVTLNGGHLIVTDNSTGTGETKIEELGGGTTAQALGLTGSSNGGRLTGKDIYFVRTIGDVVRLINTDTHNGGKLTASISADGKGLSLTDTTSGVGSFEVTALNGSKAADDLGLLGAGGANTIESRRLLAGLSTVLLRSLNGGQGIRLGEIRLTDRTGATATVDLSSARDLDEVLSAINGAGPAIRASISASGLGIELRDTSGGSGNLVIADVSGHAAEDLHIVHDGAASAVSSGNLQRQYVSAATWLDEFAGGVVRGKFRITNSLGLSVVVDLTQGNEHTLQDVIDEINSRGVKVTARINDTGDGLLLEDTAGGGGRLTVAEEGGGTAARSLGILGSAAEGQTTIDGSSEKRITVTGSDTLETLLTKVRGSKAPVQAAILNDGTAGSPYRLSLTSTMSGRRGALVIDGGTTGLSFSTLVQGRDATVMFGPADADSPMVLTSPSNTLSDVVSGVRLDLIAPSHQQAVTISVTRDVDAVARDLSSFVSAFNTVIGSIDRLTKYDAETQTAGVLHADATARTIRDGLISMVNGNVPGLSGKFSRLSGAGITLSKGTSLSFDEAAFQEAMESDPAAVESLFTTEKTGFGALIEKTIDHFTESDAGVIPLRDEAIQASQTMLNDRIAQMETLVARRRERLLAQFRAMESALSQMQTQQSALTAMANATASLYSQTQTQG